MTDPWAGGWRGSGAAGILRAAWHPAAGNGAADNRETGRLHREAGVEEAVKWLPPRSFDRADEVGPGYGPAGTRRGAGSAGGVGRRGKRGAAVDEIELFILLLIAAAVVAVLSRWMRVQYTLALLVFGLALGTSGIVPVVPLTSQVILLLFLPPLLF